MPEETNIVLAPEVPREMRLSEEWQAQRAALESLATVTVTTAEQNELAGKHLREVTAFLKRAAAMRKLWREPYKKAVDAIDALFREQLGGVEAAKQHLSAESGRYVAEERRKEEQARAEAEAAQRAEIERQVAARQAEIAAFGEVLDAAPIEPPAPPPGVQAAPRATGTRVVETVVYDVADPNVLPRAFCSFDRAKVREWLKSNDIRQQVKDAGPDGLVLYGVRFAIETSVQSTGR